MANNKTLQVVESETGELLEINMDPTGWESPTLQELGKLRKLADVPDAPMLLINVEWTEGKRAGIEGKPCTVLFYLQGSTQLQQAYSFADKVITQLRNFQATGKATPQKPLPCKVNRYGPTKAGYYGYEFVELSPEEEKALRQALSV